PRLLDAPPASRREFEHDICALPLEYAPRARSLYSDLDFILLGFLAEDRGQATLAAQFEAIRDGVSLLIPPGDTDVLQFDVPITVRERVAPTIAMPEDVRRGRTLIGE